MTPNDQFANDLTLLTNEEATNPTEATDQTSPDVYADINVPKNYVGNVGKSHSLTAAEIASIGNIGEAEAQSITDIVARTRQTGKTDLTMFQMFLQTALAEVAEYNVLIKAAKTQAKRDFYQKKIKNVTKRLKRLLPA